MMLLVRDDLPSGQVTLLFTDIERSTALLHSLGVDGYAAALAEHRRLLRTVIAGHGGVEVDTQGDAFLVVFRSAVDAVDAALAAQRELSHGPIRVRMGIHTGSPRLTSEGYVGRDVHLGARIAAAGHGGQVLISKDTRMLVQVAVTDLGEHRLKDFAEPVWIFQLGSERFPPLRTVSNTNVPRPASQFVGRSQELSDVLAILDGGARLLTLTGPGGSGKSRLAIEVASALVPKFRNGVFWVALASLRDPQLVTETIAQTLGAKDGVIEHVGERELLLVLDNFEQVVDAAAELSSWLAGCPNLRLVVTSRQVLRLSGEVEYPVLPLVESDAVALFCLRSGLPADATIAAVCRRLDQLPLAVELAAARTRVLSPGQMLDRLSQRLDLLKGGRDAEARQQTLRATIAWSYDLLTEQERLLFARLAVFTGGCTLDGAEQVCGADLDVLQGLVEKSLLRRTEQRFWMLETIHEYALERLEDSGEVGQLRPRHAEYVLELVERAEPELTGGEQQAEWLQRLEEELGNVRAVLAWTLDSALETGLRVAAALGGFWSKRGYLTEGRRWFADLLGASTDRTAVRAKCLFGAGLLAAIQGDWPAARHWSQQCHELSLALGELELAGRSLTTLGRGTLGLNDAAGARACFEQAAALGERVGNVGLVAIAQFNLGYASLSAGEYPQAQAEFEEARERFATVRDHYHVSRSLAALGAVALRRRLVTDAVSYLRESLEISQTLADKDGMAWALQLLGVAMAETREEQSARLLGAADALRETLGASLRGVELVQHEQTLATLRSKIGAETVANAWAAGRVLTTEQALEQARDATRPTPSAIAKAPEP
jgi:predicted ATPase/class 3 adenylate cyclase